MTEFQKNNALTLPEIIIVILLFSIIMGAIMSSMTIARNLFKSGSSQIFVQQEARRSLHTMNTELRQARLSTISGVIPDGTNYNSITFQIPDSVTSSGTTWSSDIQYSLGGLNSSQLIRTQDTNQRVMANNISNLTFSRSPSSTSIISIGITALKDTFPGFTGTQTQITFNSQIKVRN